MNHKNIALFALALLSVSLFISGANTTNSTSNGTVTPVPTVLPTPTAVPTLMPTPKLSTSNGTVTPVPTLMPTATPSACTPSWGCTAWSACQSSGTQVRTCTDTRNCGTTIGKPALSQSCIALATPVPSTFSVPVSTTPRFLTVRPGDRIMLVGGPTILVSNISYYPSRVAFRVYSDTNLTKLTNSFTLAASSGNYPTVYRDSSGMFRLYVTTIWAASRADIFVNNLAPRPRGFFAELLAALGLDVDETTAMIVVVAALAVICLAGAFLYKANQPKSRRGRKK